MFRTCRSPSGRSTGFSRTTARLCWWNVFAPTGQPLQRFRTQSVRSLNFGTYIDRDTPTVLEANGFDIEHAESVGHLGTSKLIVARPN